MKLVFSLIFHTLISVVTTMLFLTGILAPADSITRVLGGTATFVLYASRALNVVNGAEPTTEWSVNEIKRSWADDARIKETVSL